MTGELALKYGLAACRLAILAVYNYRMEMDGSMKMRDPVKAWTNHIDHKKLEQTKHAFRELFPYTEKLRQTLMHGAELPDSLK